MHRGNNPSSNISNTASFSRDANPEEDDPFTSNPQFIGNSSYKNVEPLDSHTARHLDAMDVGAFNPLVPSHSSAPMSGHQYPCFTQDYSLLHSNQDISLQQSTTLHSSSQSLQSMDRSFAGPMELVTMANMESMYSTLGYNPLGYSIPPAEEIQTHRRLTLPIMGQMDSNQPTSQLLTRRYSVQCERESTFVKSEPLNQPLYGGENSQRRASTSSISSNSVTPSLPRRDSSSGIRGAGVGRGKKASHELLTEKEKRANHIASEQKRRQNIRIGFERLVDIVPTLSHNHRSESVILQKSVEYIQHLLITKQQLKQRVRGLQISLGEMSDDLDDCGSTDDESYYSRK